MRRILVLGMSFNRGGMEAAISNYTLNMNAEEICFDYIVYNVPTYLDEKIKETGGRVFIIPGRKANAKEHYLQINRIFKNNAERYSAVWCNQCIMGDINFMTLAKKYGIPTRIIHAHNSANMIGGLKGKILDLIHAVNKKRISGIATDFWTCSDLAGQYFYDKETRMSNKYRIINNPVNAELFRYNNKVRQEIRLEFQIKNELVIGHVGRFDFVKNQTFLIDILNELIKAGANVRLILIGDGPLKQEVESKAKRLNLSDKVTFTGVRKDVPLLMQAMDVFTLPSLFEGFPVVNIEATAAGLPVVTSDITTKNANIAGLTTYLSLSESADVWAKAILQHKNNVRHDTYNEIVNAGFDIKNEARKLQDFFMK